MLEINQVYIKCKSAVNLTHLLFALAGILQVGSIRYLQRRRPTWPG